MNKIPKIERPNVDDYCHLAFPKPVKKEKKKRKPIKKTEVAKIIDKIDKIDSTICLLENNFICILCEGLAKFNHHYFHKGNYGVLRFEPNNHCPVCFGCHEYSIHTKGDTELLRDNLIEKIGQDAFDLMKEQGRNLADRSMPYLRCVLSIKEATLLQVVERTSSSTLSMMSQAAQKRLEQIKKKLSNTKNIS